MLESCDESRTLDADLPSSQWPTGLTGGFVSLSGRMTPQASKATPVLFIPESIAFVHNGRDG